MATGSDLGHRLDGLRAELARLLEEVLSAEVTAEATGKMIQLRGELVTDRALIVRRQTLALKANLPPPAKGRLLSSFRDSLSLLDSSLSQIDAALRQEMAA